MWTGLRTDSIRIYEYAAVSYDQSVSKKSNLSLVHGLEKLREADLEQLNYGERYRLRGCWHEDTGGRLVPVNGRVAVGLYQGQRGGQPLQHVFTDEKTGARYIVTSPELTWGMRSCEVCKFPKRRKAA